MTIKGSIFTRRQGVSFRPSLTLQYLVNIRYVRVDLTQAANGAPTGLRELEVIRK
jgi:hypothetical protein